MESSHCAVDGGEFAGHRVGAAPPVGLGDAVFYPGDRLVVGQHTGDGEKAGLQNNVDSAGQPNLTGDGARVDDIQPDVFVDDLLLHRVGQAVPHAVGRTGAIEQQRSALRGAIQHVDLLQEPFVVAADKVRSPHQIRRPDRVGAEPQMRNGLRSRLFGVVDEVALREQVLLAAEDLDGVLVGADSAVRADPEEHRAHRVGGLDIEAWVVGDAGARDIVVDADGEAGSRLFAGQFVEHAGDHGRGELLRRQPVASPAHRRQLRPLTSAVRLGQRSNDVKVQWLAQRPGLFRAVQHADSADGRWQRRKQRLHRKRPIQSHLNHPDPLPASSESGHGFCGGLGAGSHQHQHPVGLRMPGVVDDVQLPAGEPPQPRHRLFDHGGHPRVERIDGLAGLEVGVGILRGAADDRPRR